MTKDEILVCWLVMMDYQFTQQDEPSFVTPEHIQRALVERGWLVEENRNWKGQTEVDITTAGLAIVDLHGADYGLNTIPDGK